MNWSLIVSILTSLGLFKVLEFMFTYLVKDTFVAENVETRIAATRLLEKIIESKTRNHEYAFDYKTIAQIYFDIELISEVDKKLSNEIKIVFDYPYLICVLMRDKSFAKDVMEYNRKLENAEEVSINKLKKIRYLSLFRTKKSKMN